MSRLEGPLTQPRRARDNGPPGRRGRQECGTPASVTGARRPAATVYTVAESRQDGRCRTTRGSGERPHNLATVRNYLLHEWRRSRSSVLPHHGAPKYRARLTHPGVYQGAPAQVVALLGCGLGIGDPQVVAQTTQNARKQPGDLHLADP